MIQLNTIFYYGYVDFKSKTVVVSNKHIDKYLDVTSFENVNINYEKGEFSMVADKINWGYAVGKKWITNSSNLIMDNNTYGYGYKSLLDFIKRKKTKYVSGWYRLKKTSKITMVFSKDYSLIVHDY